MNLNCWKTLKMKKCKGECQRDLEERWFGSRNGEGGTICRKCVSIRKDPNKTCNKCGVNKPKESGFCFDISKNSFKSKCEKCALSIRLAKKREDASTRIIGNLRSRLSGIISGNNPSKSKTLDKYLGISHELFIEWLEFQFNQEMVWENYGRKKYWNVDHVMPCNDFNFLDEKEIGVCFNWINMRPMDGKKNSSKNSKTPPVFATVMQEVKAHAFKKLYNI